MTEKLSKVTYNTIYFIHSNKQKLLSSESNRDHLHDMNVRLNCNDISDINIKINYQISDKIHLFKAATLVQSYVTGLSFERSEV